MLTVRTARANDIPAICTLMHEHMNRAINPIQWARLFQYSWLEDKPDFGYVVVDKERVVGFVGTIYSQRWIDNRWETFCNLSSWYLLRDYRGQGLGKRLLDCFLAKAHLYHYSILTVSKKRVEKLNGLGFTHLDNTRYVFPGLSAEPSSEFAVLTDPQSIVSYLSTHQHKLLQDHKTYECRHLLIHNTEESCYLIVKDFLHKDRYCTEILYASDYDFIGRHPQQIQQSVVVDERSSVSLDSRFLGTPPPGVVIEPLPTPRYYISQHRESRDFDALYSEVVLLDYEM